MSHKHWIEPNTIFINAPIVIKTSLRGYFRWLGGLITSLLITLWFYLMYAELPSQAGMQITLSLMIGLDMWLLARIAELLMRRVNIDYSGITFHSLFSKASFEWTDIKKIEWWYVARDRIVFYRMLVEDNQALATFNTATWANLNEGIGYAVVRTRNEPIAVTSQEWLKTIILILTPLPVLIFGVSETEIARMIGFVIMRLFWAILVWQYSRRELRTLQFYMIILSITVIFSFMFFSGSDFQSTVIWWLYSPMIETVISFVVVELYKAWKKKQEQLQTE